jgi:hypothetical protein
MLKSGDRIRPQRETRTFSPEGRLSLQKPDPIPGAEKHLGGDDAGDARPHHDRLRLAPSRS